MSNHIAYKGLLLLFVLFHFTLSAQNALPDYAYSLKSQPWLQSSNASGLSLLENKKLAYAQLDFNKGLGNFINYYESNNPFDMSFSTNSYYQLNPKVNIFGQVDYAYFTGKNMGGSCLINPYESSFNLIEYSDSTAGDKVKETYRVKGGFSVNLSDRLSLGASGDYKTSSYYKTKDLRHTNDLLDIKLNTGLLYQFRTINIGTSYAYHRRIESIKFNSFGNTDQQYYTLIDYGAFMGYAEAFGNSGSGITIGRDTKPFFHSEQRLGLQLDLFKNKQYTWYNTFDIILGKGFFGTKSTNKIRFTEHSTTNYNLTSILAWDNTDNKHQVSLTTYYSYLENAFNHYTETFDNTMGSVIIYGVSQKVNNKERKNIKLSYDGFFGIDNKNPLWHIAAHLSFSSTYQRSIYYDYLSIRKQEINQWSLHLAGYKNILKPQRAYRIIANLGYNAGSGYAFNDLFLTESQGQLVQLDRYAYREFEYLTAPHIKGRIGFRYTHFHSLGNFYTEIHYQNTQAFAIQYLGNSFQELKLSIGFQY